MFKITNFSIKIKDRFLIKDLNLAINPGDKLAIIGEEGNGKSTLLKAIYNKELVKDYAVVSGTILNTNETFGYLEQKLSAIWQNCSVIEFLLKESPKSELDYNLYSQIYKLHPYIKQFDLPGNVLDDNIIISNLSGGELVKVQILKLLLRNPSILLLDEPTNDLDIKTLNWLEEFINSCAFPIIFISHDETLLENCANIILHLEQLKRKTEPKHTLFKGGYKDYVVARQNHIEKQTQIAYNEKRERNKKEEILNKIKQKVENSLCESKKNPSNGRIVAKKMANIKAQERKLESTNLTEIPEVEENIKLLLDNKIAIPNQKEIINIHLNSLSVGNKLLSNNINLCVKGPQKVAIVGDNGAGKSTLLKHLLPILKSTIGLNVGYFSQNYFETLNYQNTPIEELSYSNLNFNPRTFLGSLKFTTEEMEHKIINLSEGQKAKLLLLKLIVEKNNVLVLDEPTRNLSPLSNPVIRKILKEYNGAIISVSHDRKYIQDVCNIVYKLDKNGLHIIN